MNYKEIIDIGIKIFNFHPDEPFTSVDQLLETARKSGKNKYQYESGVVLYAESMAKYCDEHKARTQ